MNSGFARMEATRDRLLYRAAGAQGCAFVCPKDQFHTGGTHGEHPVGKILTLRVSSPSRSRRTSTSRRIIHFATGSTKGNKAEPALTGNIVLIVVLVFAVQGGLLMDHRV